jgi:hypothetical protein
MTTRCEEDQFRRFEYLLPYGVNSLYVRNLVVGQFDVE